MTEKSHGLDVVVNDPRCGRSDFVACLINRLHTEDGSEWGADVRCETCRITVEELDKEIQSIGGKLRDQDARAEFLGLKLFEQDDMKAAIARLDLQPQSPNQREQLSPDVGVYTLKECLSRGPLGTVYRATHRLLEKDVAIKLLVNDWTSDPGTAFLLNHELRMAGKLDHPYLVSITDAGTSDGHRYLAMEWIQGINLEKLIGKVGKIPSTDAAEIVRQAAVGMSAAHEKGLIHCDLRLANLMLECGVEGGEEKESARIKVMNLGLSRIYTAYRDSSANPSDAETTRATERSDSDLDHRDSVRELQLSDIHALGRILWQLTTGEPLENASLPDLSHPQVPEALAALIKRMVDNHSQNAIETMESAATALAEYSTDHDLGNIASAARENAFFYTPFVEESHDRLSGNPSFGLTPSAKKSVANTTGKKLPAVEKSATDQNVFDDPVRSHRRGSSWRVLIGLASLSFPVILFGIWLLWSLTDGGYLMIRADPTIAGSFELVSNGKVVDSIELVPGVRSVPKWYDSGDYELRISPEASSRVRLNEAVFSLKRNQSHTVSVERLP